MALATLLRSVGLDKSLWVDEHSSIVVALSHNLLDTLASYDHPPFYFIILSGWSQLSQSIWFLRIPSVLFSLFSVGLITVLAGRRSNQAGILAGLSCAPLPILLRYSQEIRQYALLFLLTTLAFFLADLLIQYRSKKLFYVLLGVTLALAAATHGVGLFLIPAVSVFIILESREWRKLNPQGVILALVLPLAGLGLVWGLFLENPWKEASTWWMPQLSTELTTDTLAHILGSGSLSTLITDDLNTVGAASRATRSGPILWTLCFFHLTVATLGNWRKSGGFAAAAITFWVCLVVYSLFFLPIFYYRTLLPGLVPYLCFLAIQVTTIRIPLARTVLTTALITVSLCFSYAWLFGEAHRPWEPWKELSASLDMRRNGPSLLMGLPHYSIGPVAHYLQINQADILPTIDIMSPKSRQQFLSALKNQRVDHKTLDLFVVVRVDSNNSVEKIDRVLLWIQENTQPNWAGKSGQDMGYVQFTYTHPSEP